MTDSSRPASTQPAVPEAARRPPAGRLEILRVTTAGRSHEQLVDIAGRAESAGFDALLIADDGDEGADPIATACALSAVTGRIGLIPAVDTSRQHPFGLARRLTGLDQVSAGRAGWAPRDTVLARLREAVSIANRLWDSWSPDAVLADKDAGVWVDVSKVRDVHFAGAHYSTRAPLDMPRGPQGELLLVLPADVAGEVDAPALVLESQVVHDYRGEIPHATRSEAAPGTTLRARARLAPVAA